MVYTPPVSNLNEQQFMSVKALMKMQSNDAVVRNMYKRLGQTGKMGEIHYGNDTRMNKIAPSKLAEVDSDPNPGYRDALMHQVDEDYDQNPISLSRRDPYKPSIIDDGHHRIALAHSLGQQFLPVNWYPE